MIKVTTRRGETDLSVIGSLEEICADTISIVVAIRKSLAEHDPRIAELYEKATKDKLIDLAFGPEDKKEEAKADKAPEKDAEPDNVEDVLKEIVSLLGKLNLLK